MESNSIEGSELLMSEEFVELVKKRTEAAVKGQMREETSGKLQVKALYLCLTVS